MSANYFSVLGVSPVKGRAFLAEEERPGRAASVAMVSYGYWVKHERDPSVLGSSIQINGRPFTIVGILPSTFTGTMAVLSPEIWVPLSAYGAIANDFTSEDRESLSSRTGKQLLLIGLQTSTSKVERVV